MLELKKKLETNTIDMNIQVKSMIMDQKVNINLLLVSLRHEVLVPSVIIHRSTNQELYPTLREGKKTTRCFSGDTFRKSFKIKNTFT